MNLEDEMIPCNAIDNNFWDMTWGRNEDEMLPMKYRETMTMWEYLILSYIKGEYLTGLLYCTGAWERGWSIEAQAGTKYYQTIFFSYAWYINLVSTFKVRNPLPYLYSCYSLKVRMSFLLKLHVYGQHVWYFRRHTQYLKKILPYFYLMFAAEKNLS